MKPIIRWTIGPSSKLGFLSLRLSVFWAKKLFGRDFDYAICHNNLSKEEVLNLPSVDILIDQKEYVGIYGDLEPCGPAWKLYPPRLRKDAKEICLDNDLILYSRPAEIDDFMNHDIFLITESYKRSYHGILQHLIKENFNINSGLCVKLHACEYSFS